MKRLLALLLLLALAGAQRPGIRVFYHFDDPSPGTLRFDERLATVPDAALDAGKMACGALFDPRPRAPAGSEPRAGVSFLVPRTQLLRCTNPAPFPAPVDPGDPVIALARDRAETRRTLRLGIFFAGNGQDPGLDLIYRALRDHYLLRIRVTGDRARMDLESARGLATPGAIPWSRVRWRRVEDPLELLFSQPPQGSGCFWLGFRWCHYGAWELPLRLRVHGDERGTRRLVLTLDAIVPRSAPLSVQGGRLTRLELVPAETPTPPLLR